MTSLFSEIPTLTNGYITLKRVEHNDAEFLSSFVKNETIYKYLPTFLFEQQYTDMQEMIHDLYNKCFAAKESLILGIYQNDNMCGLAEFYGYKAELQKTCIGYRLAPQFWGKSIATNTVALMVDHLYSKTDIEIITASTMTENKASARVLEKNGFIRTSVGVAEDWGFEKPVSADKWFR